MRSILRNIYRFFPVQLFILHFRKYQVLLLVWLILISTVNGSFMKGFGADALFLAPEYLNSVNFLGACVTGIALGVFFMSWNITTFILHSKRFKFLATTTKPFLKYCINNAIFPLLFLVYYLLKLYRFNVYDELMPSGKALFLVLGILIGVTLICLISFLYFFGAEKTIVRTMAPMIADPLLFRSAFIQRSGWADDFGLRVESFIGSRFRIRKPRAVGHYRQEFIDTVFKRHHIAAIFSIGLAFIFLVTIGFFLDNRIFEMPAAASFLILFSVMIAVIGSLTYFLQSWSLPFAILLVVFVNFLYRNEIIDPRNKAYGLNYSDSSGRADYGRQSLLDLADTAGIADDKGYMIRILEKWKDRQKSEKPVMVFINVSGGGLRSAAFVMNTLQKIDSLSDGELMRKTFLFSGASGGMLAATYYRELYRLSLADPNINRFNSKYNDKICGDLLNPVFTSMIARDIFSPAQRFSVEEKTYIKDRGYAFEKKLNENTDGILNRSLADVRQDELEGKVPLIIFNSVIKSDGRRLMISPHPLRYMMKPAFLHRDSTASPDAVDFGTLFQEQESYNLRLLTALRMNATFPYVLPNVWLPSSPVIDVMDAGLRDNFGQETTLRFIENFSEWITKNTGGVLIIQLRDRDSEYWDDPFITNSLSDMIINPVTMLQHNWHKLQHYAQTDQYSFMKGQLDTMINKVSIMYFPEKAERSAALNFHISAREKRDVRNSFNESRNQAMVDYVLERLRD